MNKTQYDEELIYPLSEFLNDLGNIAGVYFGVSIISLWFIIKKIAQQYQKRKFIDAKNKSDFAHISEVERNSIIK